MIKCTRHINRISFSGYGTMTWISLKLGMLLLCVIVVGLYIVHVHTQTGSINTQTRSINTQTGSIKSVYVKPESRYTVIPLSPEVARLAYKVYEARGDQRRDDTKIIQWVHQPRFIRKHVHLSSANCQNYRCAVAHDIRYIDSSHALIMSMEGVERYGIPNDKIQNRVRVLFDHRPPLQTNIQKLRTMLTNRSVFNWTITYRPDSDIPISYGRIVKKKAVPWYNLTNIVSRKTKTAVFFQRECKTPSKVENFLKELRRYISVDVFGDCQSKFLCNATFDVTCYTRVGHDYKFHLAFEDVTCPDYVSGDFFRYFGTDAVPVVRGGADYDVIAPKGTFINTADFKSVKALGKYLKHLDEHDSKYVTFLEAKRNYKSVYSHFDIYEGKTFRGFSYFNMDNMICDICQRLWNVEKYRKTYENIVKWYEQAEDKCVRPRDRV